MTKFLKSISTTCIPNYPDKNLPTVFIYHNGDMKKQHIGPIEFDGMNCSVEGMSLNQWHSPHTNKGLLTMGLSLIRGLSNKGPLSNKWSLSPTRCLSLSNKGFLSNKGSLSPTRGLSLSNKGFLSNKGSLSPTRGLSLQQGVSL